MAALAADARSAGDAPLIEDVWSRTEPKYRRRALVLLTINALFFVGLGCVVYWMRTGVVFAPSLPDYWDQLAATFSPSLDTQHTPVSLSMGPISIDNVPLMTPILGMLLASLVSIPILVAILYRFWSSVPFLGVVGFVAVMPWLAITLLGSCLLASVRPFRFRSRFVSALMGLLPVILYLFMASRQSAGAVDALPNPADRIKVMTPLILAVVASALVMGLVLLLARAVNYRPGAITPLLAILFLTPPMIFEFYVGRDELHYRLLERAFGPGSEYFAGEAVSVAYEDSVARVRSASPERSGEDVRDEVSLKWSLALDSDIGLAFARYRDMAAHWADRFVHRFPDSVYAPNALYLKGRALDMRVDERKFRESKQLVFYDDFPRSGSRRAWKLAERNAPNSVVGAVATYRLAKLDVRDGKIDRAISRLQRLTEHFGSDSETISSATSVQGGASGLMTRKPPEESLDLSLSHIVFQGRVLLSFLESNRDPRYGDAPLMELQLYDPRNPMYSANISALSRRYPGSMLADNLALELAIHEDDERARLRALERCAEVSERSDALPRALYELGMTYASMGRVSEARSAMSRVLESFNRSPWSERCQQRLQRLQPVKEVK